MDVDARDRGELCFDEDAETVGGSQELELGDDLFFSDDEGCTLGDVDLLGPDEVETMCSPDSAINDLDDLWPSSQSTLDVGSLSCS